MNPDDDDRADEEYRMRPAPGGGWRAELVTPVQDVFDEMLAAAIERYNRTYRSLRADAACEASLRHAHGVDRCTVSGPHELHVTQCSSCAEDDEDVELTWTAPGRTQWPL